MTAARLDLRALGACEEAVAWAATQPDDATALATCERVEWLWCLAERVLSDDAWAEYERVRKAAWSDYHRARTTALREMIAESLGLAVRS